MDKYEILESFEDKKHKFRVITPTSSYVVCGLAITEISVSNAELIVKTKCENLKIPLAKITSIEVE